MRASNVFAACMAVTLGLLVGGCGSSSPSATAPASPSPTPTPAAPTIAKVDACTLVLAAEASTAAGTAVTLGGASAVQIPGACYYGSSDGMASVLIFAQVYPDATSAEAVSPEQLAAAMNGAYGVSNATPISGIGDKAVEYTLTGGGSNGAVIFVFKSNVVIMIAVTPATSATPAEQLARIAVGRL